MGQGYAQAIPARPLQDQLSEAVVYAKNPFGKNQVPFGQFAPETERRIRVPVHENDPKLERVVKAWEKFRSDVPNYRDETFNGAYHIVSRIHCSAQELRDVITMLPAIYPGNIKGTEFVTRAGFFISALIARGRDDLYIVDTHSIGSLCFLGAFNWEKHIIVEGDAGNYAGFYMSGGSLRIIGNAGENTGRKLRGGSLTVEKNADRVLGQDMTRGDILVNGNVADGTGHRMKQGNILVMGNAANFTGGGMRGGNLTVNGDTGTSTGCKMEGGTLDVRGKCGGLHEEIYGGRIFVGGVQVYPLEVI